MTNNSLVGAPPEKIYYAIDEPWKNIPYSRDFRNHHWQTIGRTGSAPTSCANVIAKLTNIDATPVDIARFALRNGYRSPINGTCWGLYKAIAEQYVFTKYVESNSWDSLTDCISAGGCVICSMREGFWGSNGNVIFVWGYDSKYVYAVDPYNRNRHRHGIDRFIPQCRRYFCYYPIVPIETEIPDIEYDDIQKLFEM